MVRSDGPAFFGDFTERMLVAAGIGEGMRVLDVGSGAGEVSFSAASLVGPAGEVVGVDVDPGGVAGARERAWELGLRNVGFVEGDAHEFTPDRPFDAVVGRFVLHGQADPAGLLRRVAGHARPGGVVAFQEWTMTDGYVSHPRSPLWERSGDIAVGVVGRSVHHMEMGLGLYHAFVEGGLPGPELMTERRMGGGPDSPAYSFMAGLMGFMLPAAEQMGLAGAEELDVDTLEERLRDEVVALGGMVAMPSFTGAWATKPADGGG